MRDWIWRTMVAVAMVVTAVAAPESRAATERRIALVMGNATYAKIGQLQNPINDGRLMASVLEGVGFETTLLLDGDQVAMKRAIATFGRSLRAAGPEAVGLFYFAGHGVQANGRNYVMPIEAEPMDAADLDLVAVEVDWVLRQMESASNASNIVILDACRNNPFATNARNVSRGLAAIEAPTGSFVAYSTAPGDVAVDGNGVNSPFTAALAAALPRPGVPIEQTFKHVRLKVMQSTGGRQTPWDSSSMVRDLYLGGAETEEPALVQAAPNTVVTNFWESVRDSDDPARVALFLQLYPDSTYADAAQTRMAELMLRGVEKPTEPEPPVQLAAAPPDEQISEAMAFEEARKAGTLGAYAGYLARFPNGVFAALARAEISNLVSAPAQTAPPPTGLDAPTVGITAAWAKGKSLRELTKSSPEHAPIEGLDPAAWKGQTCAACHNWSVEELCRQGNHYVKIGEDALKRKPHPFGGPFKSALAEWAKEGCTAQAEAR